MYIGQKKIGRAPEENGWVTVFYDDDTTETFTKQMFEASKSETPLDASDLRDRQTKPVASAVLKVLLEWNVKLADYDFIDSLTRTSLLESTKAAEAKFWGKPKAEVTMSELDKALKS